MIFSATIFNLGEVQSIYLSNVACGINVIAKNYCLTQDYENSLLILNVIIYTVGFRSTILSFDFVCQFLLVFPFCFPLDYLNILFGILFKIILPILNYPLCLSFSSFFNHMYF